MEFANRPGGGSAAGPKQKRMEKTGIYETKCRRCGVVHGWHYGDIGQSDDEEEEVYFFACMRDHIQHPSQSHCNVCEKDTIQDIVSYEITGGQE